MVRAKNVFMAALRLRNLTTIDLARANNMSAQNLRQKINGRETIRATEFFYLLGLLNIDCSFIIGEDKDPINLAAKDICVKELFKHILQEKGISSYEVSRRLGLNEQSMAQKILQRETIKTNEFFDVLKVLGVKCLFFDGETKMRFRDDLDGRETVAGMSDGRWYRTSKATLVASSFLADGENEFGPDNKAVDVYRDNEGRYFLVELTKGEEPSVKAVPIHVAEALLEKFGTETDPE